MVPEMDIAMGLSFRKWCCNWLTNWYRALSVSDVRSDLIVTIEILEFQNPTIGCGITTATEVEIEISLQAWLRNICCIPRRWRKFQNMTPPTGEVGCCDSRMAEQIHWWTERWLELCFLEWLQLLQWLQCLPHPQLLDVVWCSAAAVVFVVEWSCSCGVVWLVRCICSSSVEV